MAVSSFPDQIILIPGPSFHVNLAALDALHPFHYSQRLLIFRCASARQRDQQLAAFEIGLQALLLRCPVLGGIVVPLPPEKAGDVHEDWRTIVPSRGLELVVRDLRTKLDSFAELEAADFPPVNLPYELLIPVPQDLGNDRPFAACKIQLSVIEGGTIITFAMSHSVADGAGTNELMRVLSEEARLAQKRPTEGLHEKGGAGPVITLLGQDRTVMRNIMGEIPFNIEHHAAYTSAIATAPGPPL